MRSDGNKQARCLFAFGKIVSQARNIILREHCIVFALYSNMFSTLQISTKSVIIFYGVM